MDDLIGDLLDAGRIDAGMLSVTPGRRGGGADRPGEEHVPQRGRPAHPRDRPAAGAAPGAGRRAAHRPGPEQPRLQRRPALSGDVPDRVDAVLDGVHSSDLGYRRRPGRAAGGAAAPVSQVRRAGRWARAGRGATGRPGARHLQGRWRRTGAGFGRERRDRPGHAPHLHAPDRRGRGRGDGSRRRSTVLSRAVRADAHPGGGPTTRTLRYVRDALTADRYAVRVTGDPGELSELVRTTRPAPGCCST